MSAKEAGQYAAAYWEFDDEVYNDYALFSREDVTKDGGLYYHFRMKCFIEDYYSTVYEVFVNIVTGETKYLSSQKCN